MGWLWLVGSIKLKVSFAKEPYKKRRHSAKETCILIDPTDRSQPIACKPESKAVLFPNQRPYGVAVCDAVCVAVCGSVWQCVAVCCSV